MKTGKKKLIWAIDAFSEHSEMRIKSIKALKALYRASLLDIQPVYILSAPQINYPVEFFSGEVAEFKKAAFKKLSTEAKALEVDSTLDPYILTIEGPASTTAIADALNNYAKNAQADFVFIESHTSSEHRSFFGGFAETFLTHATVPAFVAGRNMETTRDLNRILFPTDFGITSETNLPHVVALAKDLGSQITLFHYVPDPRSPIIRAAVLPFGGEWTGFRQASPNQIDSARFKVTSWADRIRESGVSAEAIVSNGKVNTAEAIVNYAESGSFGVLALAAESGAFSTTLFGSTARQVVRESPCLTLLLRTPSPEE